MTRTQTSQEIVEGIRAVGNMLKMLFEAAAACRVSAHMAGFGPKALSLRLDRAKYKVAISYSAPETLWFATRCRIDFEAAVRLGVGEVEKSRVPGRYRWRRRV